jgi:ribosome-associated protein
MNRTAALERLRARLEAAQKQSPDRLATKIPRRSKRRRLDLKRRQAEKKQQRRGPDW